eukprot:scaffold228241_cov23-Cyclotella_meneghiniana.AAC.1
MEVRIALLVLDIEQGPRWLSKEESRYKSSFKWSTCSSGPFGLSQHVATRKDLLSACNVRNKKQRASKPRKIRLLWTLQRLIVKERSSQPLTELCSKKGVTPLSKFPSVAGVSKLKKPVRLYCDEVKEAFAALRRDIDIRWIQTRFTTDLST